MVFVNYTSLRNSLYSFRALQVTPKTLADVKGGTLISYEGKAQVNMPLIMHVFVFYLYTLPLNMCRRFHV